MRDDHNIVQLSLFNVANSGLYPVGDGQRPQVSRLPPSAGQIDSQHSEIRF